MLNRWDLGINFHGVFALKASYTFEDICTSVKHCLLRSVLSLGYDSDFICNSIEGYQIETVTTQYT